MTILLISHTSQLNGAERSLIDLALGLKAQNIECVVLCPEDGPLLERLREEEILVKLARLHRPQRNLMGLIKFVIFWIPTVLQLSYFIKRNEIQVVYNNTIDGLYGPFSAYLVRIPCIWHVREVKPNNRWLRAVFTWLLLFLPTKTIFNSKATLGAYSENSHPNWLVIHNGVNINANPPKVASKKSALTIGFAGQMVENKHPERFVYAFAMAKKSCPEIMGVMAGDGLLFEETRLLIENLNLSDSIEMLGRVNNMTNFYSNIDILVLTSDKEAFGRVLVEAMSFGCPVIAANVGGVSEVVKAGETGFLVQENDIEAYAKKIVLLTTEHDLSANMGWSGYERAANEFSVFKYRKRLVNVFEQVNKKNGKHHSYKF